MSGSGAGAGAGGGGLSTEYVLSRELTPAHEGGVQALCVLHDGTVVTGGDDRVVKIWPFDAETNTFKSPIYCAGFGGMIRDLLPIPAMPPSFPLGGFAVASLDKAVSLFSADGSLIKALSGHTGGVVSLSWSAEGALVSGSWDGTARVWDIESGTCMSTLGDHENAVCVLGMPDGSIVTGSTGVKDDTRHVGFRVRIWRDGKVVNTYDDHEGPVRCVAHLPDVGFMSTSNDGTVKIRTSDGEVVSTLSNPPAAGKLSTVYHVVSLEGGDLVTANEDTLLRVYRNNELVQEIPHPGTPWCVAPLPNGNLVTVCNQAGTSLKGHAYVWTTDPAQAADEDTLAEFSKAMTPPSAAGGGGSGPSLGDEIKSLGPFENRGRFRGRVDGSLGYFTKADGSIWVCNWKSATETWEELGEVQGIVDDPETFDVERTVALDSADGGVRSLSLKFNFDDEPSKVARTFIAENKLSIGEFEQIRDFVLQERDSEALTRGVQLNVTVGTGAPGAAAKSVLPTTPTFPMAGYTTVSSVKLDKAMPKLLEFNAEVTEMEAALGLTDADQAALASLKGVLQATSRYHSSKLTPAMVAAMDKCLKWPPTHLLPVLDVMRVVVVHPDGAAAVERWGADFVTRIATVGADASSPTPVSVLAPRLLFNLFSQSPTRRLAAATLPTLLRFCATACSSANKTVRSAGSFLLYNCTHWLYHQRCSQPQAAFDTAFGDAAVAGVEAVAAALPAADDPAVTKRVLASLGNLVVLSEATHKAAAGKDLQAAAAAVSSAADPSVSAAIAHVASVW